MHLYRRIAAALLCAVLLFGSCASAGTEAGSGVTQAAYAAKKKSSLTVSGPKYVVKGKKILLKANRKVKWKSGNTKIATVDKNGVVKAKRPGTVSIIATVKGSPKVRKVWKVTVTAKAVKEITITADTKKLDLGENRTVMLKAKVSPSKACQEVKWSSSDPSVAKVSSTGKVTAKKEGKVTITAKALDGSGKKGTIRIIVKEKKPEKQEPVLKIKEGVTRIKAGEYEGNRTLKEVDLPQSLTSIGSRAFADSTLQYIYIPAGVTSIADDAFEGCAKLLGCLAPGGSYAAEWCAVHGISRYAPDYIAAIKPEKKAVVKNGKKQQIDPGLQPAVSKAKLSWASSDEKILTVEGNGRAFGVYPGKAALTVSSADGSKTAKISVTVEANYRAVLFSESTFGGVIQRNRGDVRLMRAMLAASYGPDGGQYKVHSYDDLVANEVYEKIDQLLIAPSRDGDVSMFFFASHGDYQSTTEKYAGRLWCKNKQTWLELPKLAKRLSKIKGKVIVLLESCGPGAALHEFGQNGKAGEEGGEGTEGKEEYADEPGFSRDVIGAFSSVDPGLSVYQPRQGAKASTAIFRTSKFVVMTASAYLQKSYSIGTDTYNLFPVWLTKGVGNGKSIPADRECGNKDGKLTVQELYQYVYNHTVYKQTPQVYPKNCDYVLFKKKKK